MGFHRHTYGGTIQRNGSPSTLSRGILKRKIYRDIMHFNADDPNTELSHRTIHAANQLSIYGAVPSWCEEFGQRPDEKEPTSGRFVAKENVQFLKIVKPQEVNSLVQTPRSDDPACGNRLRLFLQSFETLEKEIQITKVCEDASSWKRESIGMCCKTIADVDDGFGDRTPACGEQTHPHADSGSRNHASIPGRTRIGPVLQVILYTFLALMELEFRFHPRQHQIETLGL